MRYFLFFILFPSVVFATPSISSISGTPGNGNSLTINGSDLGDHPSAPSNQKPTVFTDFEDGDIQPDEGEGLTSSWTSLSSCMGITSVSAAEGTYAVRASGTDSCQVEAYLRIPLTFGLNNTIVASVHRINQLDPDKNQNWKYWRLSENGGGNIYPNLYIGEAPGGSPYFYVESCPTGTHQDFFSYSQPGSAWKEDSLFLKKGASETGATGYVKSRQNGVFTVNNTAVPYNCSGQDTGDWDEINIQDDISNATESKAGYIYYDYVYIDTSTPNYFMFTNASTLGSSTKFWLQPYTAMENTQAVIKQHWADLSGGASNIWVYACVNGNDCSSGKQLSTAGTQAAPNLTNINPSTASYKGGTTISLIGTDFLSGAQVKFGTMSYVSSTFINSSSITAVAPAGPHSGVTVDVTVRNPDLQTDTITSTLTYTTYVPDPAPTLSGIHPSTAAYQGGTTIYLRGSNFVSGFTVKFGTMTPVSGTFVNSSSVSAVAPAGPVATTVDVRITNPDTQTSVITSTLTYSSPPPPTLTSINPSTAVFSGGTVISLIGSNFVSGFTVQFGTMTPVSGTFVNSSSVTAVSPAGPGGQTVDVRITNPDLQTSVLTSTLTYTAFPAPNPVLQTLPWKR